jgi:trans-2,3-dihydro-3-hydroxyanthranilate isomerase
MRMASQQHYKYRVVDVFTKQALEGNSLAVFTDASGLEPATMQRIARELNLAETTFVLPSTRSDCAARVRIFTPAKELLFAGHPTIGTSFVLIDEGRVPATTPGFLLEENIGPVAVRVEAGDRPMIWLTTPTIATGRCYDPTLCAELLGLNAGDLLDIAPQLMNAGNPTVFVALRDKQAVDRAWIDLAGTKKLRGADSELMCVFVFTPTPKGVYSRMFGPDYGLFEDPATGSSTGPLAAYMMHHGLISNSAGTRMISEQGTKMGRRSFLHVHVRGKDGSEGIEVGGYVTPVASATMSLGSF